MKSTGGKSNRNQQQHKQNLLAICTLWSGKAIRRPAEWVTVGAQDGVFLLHTKPGMLVFHHLHQLLTWNSKIGFWKRDIKKTQWDNQVEANCVSSCHVLAVWHTISFFIPCAITQYPPTNNLVCFPTTCASTQCHTRAGLRVQTQAHNLK